MFILLASTITQSNIYLVILFLLLEVNRMYILLKASINITNNNNNNNNNNKHKRQNVKHVDKRNVKKTWKITEQLSNFKILTQIQSKDINTRKIAEALLIQRYKPTLNTQGTSVQLKLF